MEKLVLTGTVCFCVGLTVGLIEDLKKLEVVEEYEENSR